MNGPLRLLCPACHAPVAAAPGSPVSCPACGYQVPQLLGILDMRLPGSTDSPEDAAAVGKMVACFAEASYLELLDVRLRNSPTFGDCLGHEAGYHRASLPRGRAMVDMFRARLAEHCALDGQELALDLGCGSGACLPALAGSFAWVIGLDPGMPELILAAKLLAEMGIRNVCLVRGYGQSLPFPAAGVDYVNAVNVLEHVFDVDPVLREVRRVLRPGGGFAADSRNRFDLFLPEPHVKVRWVGLMPRSWAARYVRWRRGVGYTSTRLLSYGELEGGLRRSFAGDHRIVFPFTGAYGRRGGADAWLRRLEKLPPLRVAGLWVFPSHLALAWVPR